MKTKFDPSEIGKSLSEYSRGAEFTAQRGLVGELYPFLVDASARMSSRAISRFLEKKHSVKLSYATITKALNGPEKYWRIYFDSFLTEAAYIEQATKIPRADILLNPKGAILTHIKQLRKQAKDGEFDKIDLALVKAQETVSLKWYSLNLEEMQAALPYLKHYLDELNPNTQSAKANYEF